MRLLGIISCFSCLILLSTLLYGQIDGQQLMVELQHQNGQTFPALGTGGMNLPQFSTIDLNEDGREDIFVFDKAGSVILPYINQGTADESRYVFAPKYANFFPQNLRGWVLLRDYNGDGVMDIFTQSQVLGVKGITVYQGQKNEEGVLSYQLIRNYHNDVDLLSYTSSSNLELEIYVENEDLPAIVDVDGDKDLDILAFNTIGSRLFYYKNESVEKGFGADSLIFSLADQCWGKFIESDISDTIQISKFENFCADEHPRMGNIIDIETRHSGSTVVAWDRDKDGDLELLVGDISSNTLSYLNSKKSGSILPWLNELIVNYPSSKPVNITTFTAPFILDTNNDGEEDLVVAPNGRFSENINMVWRYEESNKGFVFQETNFLVGQDWDGGQGSHPAFWDYNEDGLVDLLVGTDGYFVPNEGYDTRLVLFKNIGSAQTPIFRVEDENWLSFNQYKKRKLAPTIGDLDGDGDLDILVGEQAGSLFFIENKGSGRFEVEANFQAIQAGIQAQPALIDLNQDSLLDIVTGFAQGGLNFYKNKGTKSKPSFEVTPSITALGGVNVSENGVGNAAPTFFIEKDTLKAIVGSFTKKLSLYSDISIERDFSLLSTNYGSITQGTSTTLDIADIDTDGYYELVVGNQRGGLAFYETSFQTNLDTTVIEPVGKPKLVPNPAEKTVRWLWSGSMETISIVLMDVSGKILKEEDNSLLIALEDLSSGVYIIQLKTPERVYTEKLIKY